MYAFRETTDLGSGPARARVEVAFTDASLDLLDGREGGADALAALVEDTGVPVARLNQVHGAEVVEVTAALDDDLPTADAQVTTVRGLGLMIRVADCVPVILADPAARVIGAVHAGRRGVELDVVGRALDRMRDLGARDVRAWIGPHVCGRCYEVPEPMRAEVVAAVPATHAQTAWGTPSLDLGAGVRAQLADGGVAAEAITVVDGCTVEDRRFHSYRRDGAVAGRLGALVWRS